MLFNVYFFGSVGIKSNTHTPIELNFLGGLYIHSFLQTYVGKHVLHNPLSSSWILLERGWNTKTSKIPLQLLNKTLIRCFSSIPSTGTFLGMSWSTSIARRKDYCTSTHQFVFLHACFFLIFTFFLLSLVSNVNVRSFSVFDIVGNFFVYN